MTVVDHEHAPALSHSAVAVDRAKARLRLGRKLVLLLVATAALCAVVVWHRDATHIEKACERLKPAVASLQHHLDTTGTLPASYLSGAGPEANSKHAALHYAEPEVIRWAMTADEPVIIGQGPSNGLIRANGRAVVIYDHGDLRIEWRSYGELGPRLAEQRRRAGLTPASP